MARRTEAQKHREAAQARARRLQARIAKERLPTLEEDKARNSSYRFGTQPTDRELEMLAEVFIHGGFIEAAYCMGVATHTVKGHLSDLYGRIGARGHAHAAVVLGWMAWPRGLVKPHRPPLPPVEEPDVVKF